MKNIMMWIILIPISVFFVLIWPCTVWCYDWTWPVPANYDITTRHDNNIGVDMACPIGTEVYAVGNGTVLKSIDVGCTGSHWNGTPLCDNPNCPYAGKFGKNQGSYCNYIVIDHGNNVYSLYAHLSTGTLYVQQGQKVTQGQLIAKSGNAGKTYTGNGGSAGHLHFEFMVGGLSQGGSTYNKNPSNYLTQVNVNPVLPYTIITDYPDDFYSYIISSHGNTWRHIANVNSNVQISDWNDSADPKQIWHFVRQGDGAYKIFNCYDDSIMDIDGNTTTDGANIQMWSDNGGDNQKWYIIKAQGEDITLKSKFSDLVMDVNGGRIEAGQNVQGWTINNTAAQDFNVYLLTNDGVNYAKPERPDKLDTSTFRVQGNHNLVTFSWPEAPLKNRFDDRVYDVRIYKDGQVLDDKCVWATRNNSIQVTLDEPGAYSFSVASVNTRYYEWYRISDNYNFMVGSEMASGGEKLIPDGDYLIAAAKTEDRSTFYYLDIEGTDQPAKSGTNVSLCGPLDYNPPSYEIWTLSYKDGFYTIKQKGTDMCLDIADGSVFEGGNVWVCSNNNSSAQKWVISYNGDDGYQIQSKCSGLVLDIFGGKIENYVNVNQWRSNQTAAQKWMFIPYQPEQTLAEGRYVLLSCVDISFELDVSGDTGDVEENTNVQIWSDDAPSKYNSFDIKKLDNGYYRIIHAASGKSLDVSDGLTTFGQNIAVHTQNGSPAQEWAITKDGDSGGYVLRSRASGMAMDLKDGVTENGTNIRQFPYNGTKAQTWKFVPAEYTVEYDANGGESAPAAQTKYYKTDIVLSEIAPTRNGYEFLGWGKTANAVSAVYQPGDEYGAESDLRIYAIWKELKPDLILPASLTTIEEEAFVGGSFTYVQLAEGTTTIGKKAFANCYNLKHIYIPEATTTIASTAFADVDKSMTIHGAEGSYAKFYANKYGFQFVAE